MTKEPPQDGHRADSNRTTFRLPERYSGLALWAESHGFADALEIIFLSIGGFADPHVIINLRNWVTNDDYRAVWQDWKDHPVAFRLHQFFIALDRHKEAIDREDTGYPPLGSAKDTRSHFSKENGALLAPILYLSQHRVAAGSPELTRRYRLLMWLFLQGGARSIERGGGADRKINNIALYLTADSNHEHWVLVDQLLARIDNSLAPGPVRFDRFGSHLLNGIELSRPPPGTNRSLAGFLNNLSDIALGQWGEDVGRHSSQWSVPQGRYQNFEPIEPEPWFHEELGEWLPLGLSEGEAEDLLPPDEEEDPQESILLHVDPNQTELEQTLASRSVFLQSAEQSHFLPWSWDKLLPPEIAQLQDWIVSELDGEDRVSRTGAALVWVAMHTGRSLYHTIRIAVSGDYGEEWSISRDYAYLHRRAPRRHSAWQPRSEAAIQAVKPSDDRLTFSLPDAVTAALSASSDGLLQPGSLWDLWQSVNSTDKVEAWFDRQMRDRFPRVTSGKLEQVAAQQIFDRTGDDHLARILMAPPRSGLPAACGYANWDMKAIAAALPPEFTPHTTEDPSTLFLGSMLAPLEALLRDGVKEAGHRLSASREDNLVSFHNQYASYVTTALYAATGSRHLRSPFESIDHFSLEFSCVYINDKNDDGVHAGRLVPLPRAVITILKRYCTYLQSLADAISPHKPVLAAQIRELPQGGRKLPLFFTLDGHLNWHQMSDSNQPGLLLFDWPLPRNLFRHRYAQQMANLGVETDVIDGWMGHAERAVATYGDSSPRCWADDAKRYQAEIDACFDGLGFKSVGGGSKLPAYIPPDTNETPSYSSPEIFGKAERQKDRRLHRKRSTQRALIEIEEFLDGRGLESLSGDEFEALSRRILLRRNGLPYADAANRYRVLNRKVRRLGAQCARKVRSRYAQFTAEKSLVMAEVIPALALWKRLNQWSLDTRQAINRSKASKSEAICIGILLFCIEKRVSYKSLVFDGLKGRNFRLVQHKKNFYLEYSEEWDPSDFSVPTQRHQISYKVASLLEFGKTARSAVDPARKTCPKRAQGLVELLFGKGVNAKNTTIKVLFDRLMSILQQVNLVTLPGMVAASLSERRPATSLPWQDVLRITERQPRIPPVLVTEQAGSDIEGLRVNQGVPLNNDQVQLQDSANKYNKEVMHLIKGYVRSRSRDCAKAIERLSRRHSGQVSTATLMLGYWIAYRIRRGKGGGKHHKPYEQSTVERYFSALRKSFEGVLYDSDLLVLDGDEITDLYGDMLEACRAQGNRIDYFSARLKEFHGWAESKGCESVDWSELDTDDNVRSVSPGCISERDYLSAQKAIAKQFHQGTDEALFLGFVLLLAFRFGLRLSEATGLRRDDWCRNQGDYWVLVHNNYLRKLKRPSSRRAVPSLFVLTNQELRLIEAVMARHEALSPAGENTPILCDASGGKAILSSKVVTLSRTLIDILRATTGNPQLRLHHCRHSFYNVVASILLPINSPTAKALRKNIDATDVKRRILGDQYQESRRTGMALARLMGHHRPNTGLTSYNHLLSDWADSLTPVESIRIHALGGVYDTKSFSVVTTAALDIDIECLKPPPPTLESIFRTLRLVAFGKSFALAGQINLLPPQLANDLEEIFSASNAKMRFKLKRGERWLSGKGYPNALLHYVSDTAWLRMLACAKGIEPTQFQGDGESFPPLIELPAMTGLNRHILVSHQRHVDLAALVLRSFRVETSAFEAVYAYQDNDIARLMRDKGWTVIPLEEKTGNAKEFQLDVMTIVVEQKDDRRLQRGGIVMSRQRDGILRNGYELAVALLAVGVFLNWSIDKSSEPAPTETRATDLEKAALSLMMGVPEAAKRWLNTPTKALGSMTPNEYATQHGPQDVFDLIRRLKDGIH